MYEHLKKLKTVGLIDFKTAKNQYTQTKVSIKVLGKMPNDKTPNQNNDSETPSSEQTDQQSMQNTDNQSTCIDLKQVNTETSKQKTKTVLEESILEAYESFYFDRTNIKIKLSKNDKQALPVLAEFLEQCEEPLKTWEELLFNWKQLTPYFQSEITLEQIEKNFSTPIDQIKNHDSKHQRNTGNSERQSNAERKDYGF